MLQEFNQQHNDKASVVYTVASWWLVWWKPARAFCFVDLLTLNRTILQQIKAFKDWVYVVSPNRTTN
jgi:hypothetical protein